MLKRKTTLLLALALSSAMLLSACGTAVSGDVAAGGTETADAAKTPAESAYEYEVYLPEDYEEDVEQSYPVLYLLPDDGISAYTDAVVDEILSFRGTEDAMNMIVVCPVLPDPREDATANVHEILAGIVAEIDEAYRTVASAEARAAAGIGTGGFLASVLTYTNAEDKLLLAPDLFGLSGSISGDYVSDENPWLSVHGGFNEIVKSGGMTNDLAQQYFTYMTTASEEPNSYEKGGANDVIGFFIKYGAAYAGQYYDFYGNADDTVLSLTIKNGSDDEAFRLLAVDEMLSGFSRRMAVSEIASSLPAFDIGEEEEEKTWEPWDLADAVDLMGEWYFSAEKSVTPGTLPEEAEYRSWETVVPALGWWDSDLSKNTDMKAFVGYAWYVKEFTLPEDYPEENYYFPVGYFDETDIVFVNGEMIGSTGLDPETWQHVEDCWDEERIYMVPSEVLNFGGENVVTVLTHNQSGDGGWYDGHPGLLTAAAYEELTGEDPTDAGDTEREGEFFTVTYDSAYRASALKSEEATLPETMRIYLPAGYFDEENKEKQYPTAYLFHQLNSTSNSYAIDGIDDLMNEGIASGQLKELIVVAPDSNDDGFWMGDWEKMVTEEIIPYIDDHYRTLADASHRFTAGASMGGSGAYNIGLNHPELFSGIVSYFGAINMGGNPLMTAQKMSADELSYFTQYFVCGNRDLYKFGLPAIQLDRRLRDDQIDHFFELGEGGHDSAYYLPYVIDSFAYQLDAMPSSS